MPKLSYGPAAKRRTLALLMALVDYGNDELVVANEDCLERLRSHLSIHWATDRQLIVRTKIRHLEALMSLLPDDQALSKAQIKTALHHLEHHMQWLEDNRTSRRGSEVWHFTISLGLHRRDRTAILARFDQVWEQRRGGQVAPSPLASVDDAGDDAGPDQDRVPGWRQHCQRALAAMAQGAVQLTPATVSPLPLTLMDHGVQADQEAAPISTALLLHHMDQQQIRQVAIVGEPGAGKTTLLQQLAHQILERSNEVAMVIPLAQLGAARLDDYILNDWLPLALGKRAVPSDLQAEWVDRIERGQVWLLLDAVDELGGGGSVAIATLAQQLQGWLGNSRIILTCRLNLWDAGKNALGHLCTYRLVGGPRHQIQPFIRQWFARDPQRGESLCQQLSLPEYRRLRNNLRNPLRLALFCRLGAGGQLPTTQHQLYQQFVTALYDWQQDSFPTTLLDQHHMNRVLSRLALATLRQGTVPLNLALVLQTLSAEDLPWFERAVQLGWLTPMPTVTGEKVYGFLHGTFRDYFAAEAIDGWQRFTTMVDGTLPMVLPHWQTVILLWLGRGDIAVNDKHDFMNALVQFQDGCGQFFEYRVWLLAARALGEQGDYPGAEEIIQRLLAWRFNLSRDTSPILIEAAKDALAESDLNRVATHLARLAQDETQDMFDRWMAAYSLGRSYDPQSPVAVATLETLLVQVRGDALKMDMARHLGTLVPGHPLAVQVLVEMIETASRAAIQRKAAVRLAKVDGDHPLPVATLEHLLVQQPDSRLMLQALASLQPDHPLVRHRLTASGPRSGKPRTKRAYRDPAQITAALVMRLEVEECDRKCLRLAGQLNQLQPGHPLVIEKLWRLIITASQDASQETAMLKRAGDSLLKAATVTQMPSLVTKLRPLYHQSPGSDQQRVYFRLLWAWSEALGYQQFLSAHGFSC